MSFYRTRINLLFRQLGDQRGFATLPAFMAMIVGTLLSLGAWATAHSDVNMQDKDRWSKVAYTKAQSGVTDYIQRMAEDSSYWQNCDQPNGTNDADGIDHAINDTDVGAAGHLKRRWWPTPSNLAENTALTGQYTIDLVPANGQASCKANGNRAITMVDEATGAIRVRVTGRAGPAVPNTSTINPDPAAPNTYVARNADSMNTWRQKRWKHRSIVVEFRRRGFLDYAYFTDREGLEPTLYSNSTTRDQCDTYWRDTPGELGRYRYSCTEIQFADGDLLKGPFHTNDSALLGSYSTTAGAKFGNDNKGDRIEVFDNGLGDRAFRTGTNGNFYSAPARRGVGTNLFVGDNAGFLDLPESNEDLVTYADPNNGDPDQRGLTFWGQTRILLKNNGTVDVTNSIDTGGATINYAVPTSGVIRIGSTRSDCDYNINSGAMYPFVNTGCGVAEVSGTYNKPLTITSDADVVITGNVIKDAASPTAVLGLIGTNFVRIRHYYESGNACGNTSGQTGSDVTQVDAAILALTHSFMVDRHSCGTKLGQSPNYYLTVNGVIAQKYRGPVGTSGGSGGTGYIKNYSYDYRYRYLTPPHFLVPTLSSWKTSRSREQTPACACTG